MTSYLVLRIEEDTKVSMVEWVTAENPGKAIQKVSSVDIDDLEYKGEGGLSLADQSYPKMENAYWVLPLGNSHLYGLEHDF